MPNEQQQLMHRGDFAAIEKAMQDAGFDVERVKREISFAIQSVNRSAQLQKCSKESILQAVLNVANVGLTLNPAAKEAYLIPRYSSISRALEVSLDPSYIGLVKLLTDTGSVKAMVCQIVYAGDQFDVDLANNLSPVVHRPQLSSAQRGNVVGVYALATLSDNTRQVEWMDLAEIEGIRDRSETYKAFKNGKIQSCTWASDFGEMARKTVIKRIYKYLPRTEKAKNLDQAIDLDNEDYRASDKQVDHIENLLRTSTLDERQRSWYELELPTMGNKRATEVIEMLNNNQQDRFTQSTNYSMTEKNHTSLNV
jgi:phage RecT family recombinase